MNQENRACTTSSSESTYSPLAKTGNFFLDSGLVFYKVRAFIQNDLYHHLLLSSDETRDSDGTKNR